MIDKHCLPLICEYETFRYNVGIDKVASLPIANRRKKLIGRVPQVNGLVISH